MRLNLVSEALTEVLEESFLGKSFGRCRVQPGPPLRHLKVVVLCDLSCDFTVCHLDFFVRIFVSKYHILSEVFEDEGPEFLHKLISEELFDWASWVVVENALKKFNAIILKLLIDDGFSIYRLLLARPKRVIEEQVNCCNFIFTHVFEQEVFLEEFAALFHPLGFLPVVLSFSETCLLECNFDSFSGAPENGLESLVWLKLPLFRVFTLFLGISERLTRLISRFCRGCCILFVDAFRRSFQLRTWNRFRLLIFTVRFGRSRFNNQHFCLVLNKLSCCLQLSLFRRICHLTDFDRLSVKAYMSNMIS